MIYTSPNPDQSVRVLYHAVSSYQLLEVMLHRMTVHPHAVAVLLLPDFITAKYPQYRKLVQKGFFNQVYLFPYLRIPHTDETQIQKDVSRFYEECVPWDLRSFQEIYVAGAHFYFSLLLISREIPFTFFEDAAGMLSRAEELYHNLLVNYPLHAAIAQKYGLFDGSHPLIRRILCLKKAQADPLLSDKVQDFTVQKALLKLSSQTRRRLIHFFVKRRYWTRAEGILLTQHFSNLGIMTREEQVRLYQDLANGPLKNRRLLIKPHPDDTLDYTAIFPGTRVIRQIFPAELLPYIFVGKPPQTLYTVNSTGCENLQDFFNIKKIGWIIHDECQNFDSG